MDAIAQELDRWEEICGGPLTGATYEVWLSDPDGNRIEDPQKARTALDLLLGPDPERIVEPYHGGAVLSTLPIGVITALHEATHYDCATGGYSITIELP